MRQLKPYIALFNWQQVFQEPSYWTYLSNLCIYSLQILSRNVWTLFIDTAHSMDPGFYIIAFKANMVVPSGDNF